MSKLYVCKEYETPYEEGCTIITTLDEHDSKLLKKVAVRTKLEMIETYPENIYGRKVPTPFAHFSYTDVCDIVDKVIAEMKAEVSE